MARGSARIKIVKSGRIVVGNDLQVAIEKATELERAAEVGLQIVQSYTPVVTGHLYRSWRAGRRDWIKGASVLFIQLFNTAVYARKVNTVGRSAGYADKGFEEAKKAMLDAIASGNTWGTVTQYLWKEERGG